MDSSSEPEISSDSSPSSLEDLLRTRTTNLSLLLPLILEFVTAAPSRDDQQSGAASRETTFIINPRSQWTIMIGWSGDLEATFRELSDKDGPSPASKASIEAMPVVTITEERAECAICLTEYDVGGEAREMPCKHRYHSDCIEKWLGIHGSCPVCRYKMPVDEEENQKGTGTGGDGDEEEGRETRVGGGIQITFLIGGTGDRRDSNSGPVIESGDTSSDSTNSDGAAADGSSTQDIRYED